jgi:hypothetical protein
MSALLTLDIHDEATAPLRRIMDMLQDRAGLHRALAGRVGDLVSNYIIFKAAPERHATARRLGADVTNYLTIAGRSVTNEGNAQEGIVAITQNSDIFARVAGPVNVRIDKKKWLTIANDRMGYGKRAEDVEGLEFVPSKKSGLAMLIWRPKYVGRPNQKRRTPAEAAAYREEIKRQSRVIYWLKKEVTLPQDRGLLPSDEQFFAAMEEGVREAAETELNQTN